MEDIELFFKVKKEAEEFYKKIGKIYCPYFKSGVSFNAKGLDHIKFKDWNKARLVKDQFIRLKLIKYAPEIINFSHTLQGHSKTGEAVRLKDKGNWNKTLRKVNYYEFIAIIKKIRIRVIVKEVEGGEKHFWSIIPFWRMNKSGTKRLIHDGRPDID